MGLNDVSDLRLRNLEATITDLRKERREDRALIKEILAQVLTLTDKQTQLLQEWTSLLLERRAALKVDRLPVSYTLTEQDEYEGWMKKHHPDLLAEDREVDYNSSGHDRVPSATDRSEEA